MKITYLFVLMAFDLVQAQYDWFKNIKNVGKEIRLEIQNKGVNSTLGLKYHINITYADLSKNNLLEVGELSYLTELKYLYLNLNKLQNVQGIENLTKLLELRLDSNQIKILPELHSLTKLTDLYSFK